MAKVKVLKDSELIGGTDNSSVYPITHTKAVFNSNNKELDQILNELEQQITSSSLSNFVLDLGFVSSQDEGEQIAARSEVAGNRNISFIRFQVQGVEALKTTLIMQWPNGINETAQIMCVDKAQWRRNVTGATGVKGDPTNAFQWERTAPHFIAYDKSRRMIQLKDYQQIVLREVELPLATSTQHGLMSAADKMALDKAAEKADTSIRILTFASTLEDANIEEQSIEYHGTIVFIHGKGCFTTIGNDNKYYNQFQGSEDFNIISEGVIKARKDRLYHNLDDDYFYHYDGTSLKQFVISDEERTKLAAYPSTPLNISLATESSQGLMSAEDKRKINNEVQLLTDIVWSGHNMNEFVDSGEYYIHGQRTIDTDNLPIINVGGGHTINARLTVLNSSLNSNPNDKANICVTQILRLSNRKGGDGHVYVRTGQGANMEEFTWSTWEKLMGIFEKNNVTNIEDIDSYTTNGMYSGIYASESKEYGGIQFFQLDTFLIITINGYAVSKLAVPQITQLLYKLPTNNSGQKAEIYVRTGYLVTTENRWSWGPFLKTVTNMDLDSQVAVLNANINAISGKADAAKAAAIAAQNAAQEAQNAATTASENAAHAQELANESKTVAEQAQSTATNALSEAIEAKSNAATAFSAASNAKSVADAAQEKNVEQDERLNRIENNVAYLGIAGRYWDEDNATSTAENYYGSLQALRDLPKRLGLGRYLVTDDRKKKKLDPKDSTKYLDGSPAKLDGSEGQCMWCWNGFYANVWHEGSRLIKAVTFDKPVGGETSVWIPAGGISWLGAGVMDRTNNILCSVINDSEQFRGGNGAALDASKYSKAPAADSPQITMLGMPATSISTTNFGNYARKRGEGWEANWFVARFVVEFLFEVIMGTENSQAAFNTEKDANGLYQGGFGTGVTDMPDWGNYNGYYPVIPTSVGLEAGDGVCIVPYNLPQTNGVDGGTYKTFNVPVFFGLVGAGFGNLWQWTRGIIMDAGEEKSLVYVTPSMYADYDPNTVADKIMVAECPRVDGYIKRKSYQGLCCMPTEVGGSATIRFADYFYTNAKTSKGLRVRAAGGSAYTGKAAGASYTYADSVATLTSTHYSAPLCYFEADPVIPESEKIEL